MIAPGALVILTPVVVGTLFGTRTLSGLLAGSLVSGVQMAVSHVQHRRRLGQRQEVRRGEALCGTASKPAGSAVAVCMTRAYVRAVHRQRCKWPEHVCVV